MRQTEFISIYPRVYKPHAVLNCMTVDGGMPYTMFRIFRFREKSELGQPLSQEVVVSLFLKTATSETKYDTCG